MKCRSRSTRPGALGAAQGDAYVYVHCAGARACNKTASEQRACKRALTRDSCLEGAITRFCDGAAGAAWIGEERCGHSCPATPSLRVARSFPLGLFLFEALAPFYPYPPSSPLSSSSSSYTYISTLQQLAAFSS